VSQKRPVLFRGRHFQDVIIILWWYLGYSLSYRDLASAQEIAQVFAAVTLRERVILELAGIAGMRPVQQTCGGDTLGRNSRR
jgi:hypothetical protein